VEWFSSVKKKKGERRKEMWEAYMSEALEKEELEVEMRGEALTLSRNLTAFKERVPAHLMNESWVA
jgi:hypothetical protein